MTTFPKKKVLFPGETQQITTDIPNAVFTIEQDDGGDSTVDQNGLFTAGSQLIGAVVRVHSPFWTFYRPQNVRKNADDSLILNQLNPTDTYSNYLPNALMTRDGDYIEWKGYYKDVNYGVDLGIRNIAHNVFINAAASLIKVEESVNNIVVKTFNTSRKIPFGTKQILRLRKGQIEWWHENILIYRTTTGFPINSQNKYETYFGGWPADPKLAPQNYIGSKFEIPRFYGAGIQNYTEDRVSFCIVNSMYELPRQDKMILNVEAAANPRDSNNRIQFMKNNAPHGIDGYPIPGTDPKGLLLRMDRAHFLTNHQGFHTLRFHRNYEYTKPPTGCVYKFANLLSKLSVDTTLYTIVMNDSHPFRSRQSIHSFPADPVQPGLVVKSKYPDRLGAPNTTGLYEGFGATRRYAVFSDQTNFPSIDGDYRLMSVRAKMFDWDWRLDEFQLRRETDDYAVPNYNIKDYFIGGSTEYPHFYEDMASFFTRQWVIYNVRLNDAEHAHAISLFGEAYKLTYAAPVSGFSLPTEITVGQTANALFAGLGGFDRIIWRVNGVERVNLEAGAVSADQRHLNTTPYLVRGSNSVQLELDGRYGNHVFSRDIIYKTKYLSIAAGAPHLAVTEAVPDDLNIEVAARAKDQAGNRSDWTTEDVLTPAPSSGLGRRMGGKR